MLYGLPTERSTNVVKLQVESSSTSVCKIGVIGDIHAEDARLAALLEFLADQDLDAIIVLEMSWMEQDLSSVVVSF
jgi:hypothetical protein